MEEEFLAMIEPIVSTKEYRRLKQHRHHIRSNVYDHSVRLAYLCYRHCKRHNCSAAPEEIVRGALLHDFFLYELHGDTRPPRFHGYRHPRHALNNAQARFGALSRGERDMILRHMFPVTPIPPKTRAGWLICFYDKVAAFKDLFGH